MYIGDTIFEPVNNGAEKKLDKSDTTFDTVYNDGLNDAWDIIQKLCGLSSEVLAYIFNYSESTKISIENIVRDFHPQEILPRIEEYEMRHLFKVGDIVYNKNCLPGLGVITRPAIKGDGPYILWFDGSCGEQDDITSIRNTGRKLDIYGLLETLKGEQ